MPYVFTEVLIPHEESNYYVSVAGKMPPIEQRQLETEMAMNEMCYMHADNLSHGCGGAAVQFTTQGSDPNAWDDPCGPEVLLQLTVTKSTLAEMIAALQIVHDHLEDTD